MIHEGHNVIKAFNLTIYTVTRPSISLPGRLKIPFPQAQAGRKAEDNLNKKKKKENTGKITPKKSI